MNSYSNARLRRSQSSSLPVTPSPSLSSSYPGVAPLPVAPLPSSLSSSSLIGGMKANVPWVE